MMVNDKIFATSITNMQAGLKKSMLREWRYFAMGVLLFCVNNWLENKGRSLKFLGQIDNVLASFVIYERFHMKPGRFAEQ